MTSRRSYLETLNSGRQRRGTSSLDELTRTLEALETQLERPSPFADLRRREPLETARPILHTERRADLRSEAPTPLRPEPRAESAFDTRSDLARDVGRDTGRDRSAPRAALQSVARDLERSRREGDSVAAVGQIAAELHALREDMRQQMAASLTREFDALRSDVHRLATEAQHGGSSEALLGEVERLSGAIADLSHRSDDKNVSLLRLELDQVKGSIGALAREDTLRAVGVRWDAFDDRMSRFEERVAAQSPQVRDDAAIDALTHRLEQIAAAVDVLPESLSLRTLEDKVRTLAGALDHFARKQDAQSEQTFDMIAERLDEISRAIAASLTRGSTASAIDPAPFQRIEARMASLASQIEELIEERPAHEVLGQIAALSTRVDELAARSALPEKAVERLGQQLGQIAERLEREPAAPDVSTIFDGLEHRFAVLSDALDRRQADSMEQGNKLLRDMEGRLDTIVQRLDTQAEKPSDRGEILSVMDERFAALAARLDERVAYGPEAASIRELELRLGDIASRLDTSARQVSSMDEAVIGRLEAQVAELSVRLSNPPRVLPELEDFAPRFDQIERSLAGQHDALIEAARNAAADAVRELAERESDSEAVAGLSGELRSLEALTRQSDERNSKTFEAIHDTLIKIVDRLSMMEQGEHTQAATQAVANAAAQPVAKPVVADAPSIAADDAFDLDPSDLSVGEVPFGQREAQAKPVDQRDDQDEAPDTGSKLGGFTRALRNRKDKPQPDAVEKPVVALPKAEEPEFPSLDQPLDPRIANQPLEPGSGAPDLNAIMKRVRDERGMTGNNQDEAETAKSDFIAAARRAAQAAAAEAEGRKTGTDAEDASSRRKIGRILGLRRKTVLMATAAMVVGVGGFQLSRAFLAEEPHYFASTEPVGGENETAPALTAAAPAPAASASSAAPVGNVAAAPVQSETPTQAAPEPVRQEMPTELASAAPTVEPVEPPAATAVSEPTEPTPALAAEAPQNNVDDQPQEPAASEPTEPALATVASIDPDSPVGSAVVRSTVDDMAPTQVALEAGAVPMNAGPVALREAAQAGDIKAFYEIGTRYAEGRNGEPDMKAAADWYVRAANRGFAPAQYRLANFYEKGVGVDRDLSKAKALYEKSAEQGNASAMHNLAVLYAMGADGTTDNKAAVRWFTEAAERGIKDSQFNLGILAAKGVGLNQDLVASYKWFALVAKTGDKDAEAKRDEIAQSLKPEDLTRARADTDLWRAKPVDPQTNDVAIPPEWQESNDITASIDMKQAVRNIQLILNKNGFDAGRPDGLMGGKTKTAIIAFQKANGLTADGEVNEPLVRALLAKK
ncbi:SEL1-like repeat protein [Tianweitania sp. BSSL-BM11]|uniref:SEL1-like repeat protein n=1 Tax=Tianweitania aestuarii TaxID=2814886 RepID=A0ABS5RXK8_9HYPH|nr:peptidoglycan-binding protein [Tianweitania aestuarii]MBS9721788.1 SEL1-like repeat protein [Tianweitania aestuarii]